MPSHIFDLGSHCARFGTTTPYQISMNPQVEDSYKAMSQKRPNTPFTSGAVNDFTAFERLFTLSQLVEKPEWQQVAEYSTALFEQRNQVSGQLVLEELDQPLDNIEPQNTGTVDTVLMTYPQNSVSKKELSEILFEKYQIHRVLYAEQTACLLFSAGKTTGTSVSIGNSSLQITCYIDGYWSSGFGFYQNSLQCGYGVDKYLEQHFALKGITIPQELTKQVKLADNLSLPDGQLVKNGRKIATQLINDPQILQFKEKNLLVQLEQLFNDSENNKRLKANVVVGGGMAGYCMLNDVKTLEKPDMAAFNGLQILSEVAEEGAYITRQVAAEKGDAIWGL
ncbi:Actin_family [Hexamita inflata]|uniref:Actin family n=1 Tax=Hexamita inflata TaxID=28002 RepID=A0AA86RBE6_9EUKA|nr:Actin family [Hexamita inflata]